MQDSPGSRPSTDDNARDLALVERLRNGDPGALRALMEIHAGAMHSIALLAVRRADLAEEAIQLVFARSWERRDALPSSGSIKSYFNRAARNQAISLARHEHAHERAHEGLTREYTARSPEVYNEGEARLVA